LYADRNLTIHPKTQPSTNVGLRLYLTTAEFNALNLATNSLGAPSGIGGSISNVGIFKNSNNSCVNVLSGGGASQIATVSKGLYGSQGYVLQSNALPSFSTFYFANSALTTLPVQMLSFTGSLNNNATLLDWTTASEANAEKFVVERSENGTDYTAIG